MTMHLVTLLSFRSLQTFSQTAANLIKGPSLSNFGAENLLTQGS